jgi:hypothetical protein
MDASFCHGQKRITDQEYCCRMALSAESVFFSELSLGFFIGGTRRSHVFKALALLTHLDSCLERSDALALLFFVCSWSLSVSEHHNAASVIQ